MEFDNFFGYFSYDFFYGDFDKIRAYKGKSNFESIFKKY